jgi:hypothetical protein
VHLFLKVNDEESTIKSGWVDSLCAVDSDTEPIFTPSIIKQILWQSKVAL